MLRGDYSSLVVKNRTTFDAITTALKNELRKLKKKNVVDTAVSKPNASIAPGLFKIDTEPISPKRSRTQNPSEPLLESAFMSTKHVQELLVYVSQTCPNSPKPSEKPNKPVLTSTRVKPTTSASGSNPSGNTKNNRITRTSSSNQKNKVEDHSKKVKSSLNKMNSVSEPVSNALVKHSVRNAKFESICAICNKCLFDANPDMCIIDYVNNVNVRSKSKSKRNKMRNVWKPTGKVFTEIGYSWKPTGDQKQQDVGSSSKVKIVESKTSNSKEPKQSWGSTVSDVASSSLNDCRFGNDHIAKIMVYGDYQMRNVTISQASKTKSWLWHRRLSHLNFDYINSFAKHGLVRGLLKLKYQKDHLFSDCALGKSKKHSHKPKAEDSIQEKLYLLHIDLCGPIRVQSINGRKYILVIVDDFSWFTWVKFLRSNDEVLEFALLFVWAEAVMIACYTQNQSLIKKRHNKIPYELLHDRKLDLSYLYVFGALCYPTNDGEDLVMASEQFSLRRGPKLLNPGTISSGIVPNITSLTPYVPPTKNDWEILFQLMLDESHNPPPCVDLHVLAFIALDVVVSIGTPSSTTIDQDAPPTSTSQTSLETPSLVLPLGVEEADHDIKVTHMANNPVVEFLILEPSSKESSTQFVIPNHVHSINQPPKHINKWTKDHSIDNVIGDPSRPDSTRQQLQDEALLC
nr:integrase, catalytic region, zinc finger, CCHC-type, peptidase aspartic, catalytic [Tanacetum cinerariifolium]